MIDDEFEGDDCIHMRARNLLRQDRIGRKKWEDYDSELRSAGIYNPRQIYPMASAEEYRYASERCDICKKDGQGV
jgi:hypothetical protein